MKESRYNNEDLLVRLRAIFGRVDQIRDCIDRALQQENAHCRKRDMRFLLLPTRFPESMEQGDITVWINWICEETDTIMNQLEEERDARSDPDDPLMVLQMVYFYPYRICYYCPLQCRHLKEPKTTANIENILKNHGKASENWTQRMEARQKMRWLPLHKESHMNLENILENCWIQ